MKLTCEQEEEIISLTCDLVRIPGGSGEEQQTAAYVSEKMKSLGYDEVSVDEYGNVLGIINGLHPGPTIIFDGHMDVVPAGDRQSWHCDPHGGERIDGKIWGRGTVDMKGALAGMICAPLYLDRSKIHGKVLVSASVAEEYLIGVAFKRILDKYPVDAVVIGEPTGLQLGVGEKGRAGIELITHGTTSHSSRPDLGDNAVYRMMEAVERIKSLPRREHPFLGTEVIELVEINSSPSPGHGAIPDECRTFWECRLLHGETRETFLSRWHDALQGIDKVELQIARYSLNSYTGLKMEMEDFHPGWLSVKDLPFTAIVEKSLRDCEKKVQLYGAPYGCNALASAGDRAIPTVILGPGNIALAHKPDECIEINELLEGARIFGTITENFLKV
jgi:putative selenium metabolism hydrolase